MSLYANSTPPQAVYANGSSMNKVYANGTLVWQKDLTMNCKISFVDDNMVAYCFIYSDSNTSWNLTDFYNAGYTRLCITNWGEADSYYYEAGYWENLYTGQYQDYPSSFWDYSNCYICLNGRDSIKGLNPSQYNGDKLYLSLAQQTYGSYKWAYVDSVWLG